MQIVFGSILAISLLLAINFSGRIAAGRNISAQRVELEQNIQTLEIRATSLKADLNFVSSDAFVEQWARKEGRMVKSNERLVVPVPGQVTAQPVATPVVPLPTPEHAAEAQNWQLWWRMFFDGPPPDLGPKN
jgi:uncharacterized protein (DUF58 family)